MYTQLEQKIDTTWIEEAIKVLKPGKMLYGYCAGYFGRDSYYDKHITSVNSVVDKIDGKAILVISTIDEHRVTGVATLEGPKSVETLINASNSALAQNEE